MNRELAWLVDRSPELLDRMLHAALVGAVAFAAAWCLCSILRFLTPGIRCWIWRIAYLKLALAALWIAPISLPLLSPEPEVGRLGLPMVRITPEDLAPLKPTFVERTPVINAIAATYNDSATFVQTRSLVLAAWISISLACAMRPFQRRRFLTALCNGSWGRTDPNVDSICGQLSRQLGVKRSPPVLFRDDIATPVLRGARRPSIYLPESLLTSGDLDEIGMVIAHELAHIRRGDLYWGWLSLLTHSVFFFHPLVWLAGRELHLTQESACDALALAHTGAQPSTYGKLLLKFSVLPVRRLTDGLITASISESYRTVRRRLAAIRQIPRRAKPMSRLALVPVAFTAMAILIPWQITARAAHSEGPKVKAGPYTIQLDYAAFTGEFGEKPGKGAEIVRPVADPGSDLAMITPGFGIAPGGTIVKSNLTLRFSFDTPKAEDLMKVQWVDFDLHGTDNLGNAIPPFPMKDKNQPTELVFSPFTHRPRRTVFLRIPDERAISLKTLEGSVHIAEGKVHKVVFAGKDLIPGAIKKAGSANVVLEMLYDQTTRTKLKLSCYMTMMFEHGDGQMDAYLSSCGREWFATVIRDKSGKVVKHRGGLGFMSDEPIVTDIHLKNGQINLAESMIPGVHGRIQMDAEIPAEKKSIESIECYVVERFGPSKKVPFRFENVPISVPKTQ